MQSAQEALRASTIEVSSNKEKAPDATDNLAVR
jgi:hypothetical protein